MLRVEGLSRHFGGVYAVRDVDLDVAKGELRGIIGPNGAGKSTLFHLISGHLRPDAGTGRLSRRADRRACRRTSGRSRGIAIVFQGARIFRGMTVRENVMVGAHARDPARLPRGRPAPAAPPRGGARDPARARTPPSSASVCRTGRTALPTCCRSGSSGRCRSPARLCAPPVPAPARRAGVGSARRGAARSSVG